MSASGKVALVTGGAQGLGKAYSEILLQNDAKVALIDYNIDEGRKTLSELKTKYGQNKVMFLNCDITSQTQMKEAFDAVKEKVGGLDIVINNAGVAFEKGDLWEKMVDINLKGTIRGTMLAMEHMRRDNGGRGGVIVNVSSMAGVRPNTCGPVYGATKSAMMMYSLAWAKNPEVLANGVRINVIAPALTDTAMVKRLKADISSVYMPTLAKEIMERVGVMKPETVAEAMFELLDDQDKNGAVLNITEATGKEYLKM